MDQANALFPGRYTCHKDGLYAVVRDMHSNRIVGRDLDAVKAARQALHSANKSAASRNRSDRTGRPVRLEVTLSAEVHARLEVEARAAHLSVAALIPQKVGL